MSIKVYYIIVLLALIGGFSSCKKFLDEKPDIKLVIPKTLKDLQAVMDNESAINAGDLISGEVSADDYYLPDAEWAALINETDRRKYLWEKDFLFDDGSNEWGSNYAKVYRANTVLDNIGSIDMTPFNEKEWKDVKGQALFIRSYAFFQAATIWAKTYDESTASTDLGIPLRVKANFIDLSTRATVKETYDLIASNLKEAAQLLPITTIQVVRPSKATAYAMLARVYLSMRKWDLVALYADSSLQLNNKLIDYNTINAAATYPFAMFNLEALSNNHKYVTSTPLQMDKARVDSTLYKSFDINDIRKTAFFRKFTDNTYGFKGTYVGNTALFFGLATNEVYLMRAEAYARLGKIEAAMADLNKLLINRWKKNTFVPFNASSKEEAIQIILRERRKELVLRGLRWIDIKRLNKEGAGITLTRVLNGTTYKLLPNDLRFALPIPEDIIELTGMPQNPR